jgi:hypothetical protein
MLSRALSTATVTLAIGCFAAIPVWAQNLEAGKSPSQIFAGTCSVCHKSSRGLLKTVAPGSLPSYLRQHYTTSSDMASLLSAYLISNGATDTRYGVAPPKPGRDAKPEPTVAAEPMEPRQGRKPRLRAQPEEAANPDAETLSPREAAAAARAARHAKRLKPVPENPDSATPEGESKPAATVADEKPVPNRAARQKLGRKGKPGREPSKTDAAKVEPSKPPPKDDPRKDEPAKGETAITAPPQPEPAKIDAGKSEGGRPEAVQPDEGKADATRVERSRPDVDSGDAGKSELTAPLEPLPSLTRPTKSPDGRAGSGLSAPADVSAPAESGSASAPTSSPPLSSAAPPQSDGSPLPPISQ